MPPPETIPNIGPTECRRRLRFGEVSAGVAGAMLLVLIAMGTSRIWRVAIALPLWLGALGIFQSSGKT